MEKISYMEQDNIERLLLKLMLQDQQYLVTVISVFTKDYFNNRTIGEIVEFANIYYNQYKEIPPVEAIEAGVTNKENLQEVMREISSIDFDFAKHYDYFIDNTNHFLKNQAIKQAILNSVDIINNNGNLESIRELVEIALCKDLKVDIGLNYFDSIGERLKRILSSANKRIPTYYPQLDEYLNGGFPPYTLSAFGAAIHGWKSQTLCNMSGRQTFHGHNPVLISLEMSEDAFAQRYDASLSLQDINRIYTVKEITVKMISKLKELKEKEGLGTLFIKQFPTGTASVQDFRIYLRELLMRGINIDIVYVDYLQLMKPSSKIVDGTMYSRGKKIAEELRALSFEFKVPVVTLSQLKTESGREGVNDIDIYAFQESSAIPATADATIVFGKDEDAMIYENELYYKITKNRLGGRVGIIDKMYYDARSLKMYDVTEMELWLEDVKMSNDDRMLHERRDR
jgi:replicative DNA helicase